MKIYFILPSAWRSTSGNLVCSESTTILRESNTVYHLKKPQHCRRDNINIIVILQIPELKKMTFKFFYKPLNLLL